MVYKQDDVRVSLKVTDGLVVYNLSRISADIGLSIEPWEQLKTRQMFDYAIERIAKINPDMDLKKIVTIALASALTFKP